MIEGKRVDEVGVVDFLPTVSKLLGFPLDRTGLDGRVMDVLDENALSFQKNE